jgi:hypothetical protein
MPSKIDRSLVLVTMRMDGDMGGFARVAWEDHETACEILSGLEGDIACSEGERDGG